VGTGLWHHEGMCFYFSCVQFCGIELTHRSKVVTIYTTCFNIKSCILTTHHTHYVFMELPAEFVLLFPDCSSVTFVMNQARTALKPYTLQYDISSLHFTDCFMGPKGRIISNLMKYIFSLPLSEPINQLLLMSPQQGQLYLCPLMIHLLMLPGAQIPHPEEVTVRCWTRQGPASSVTVEEFL
jgi:hypothetical protein